jgi:glycosyltransferase involved in cell wall biosynthesis
LSEIIFCTSVIPTIGRNTLGRAVNSILHQDFHQASYEIIVVNDSGNKLPVEDWQLSEKVQVINTNRCERSVARNTGASVAKGRYLHFLDDDDWLLPDALENFWNQFTISDAPWLYGGTKLTNIINNEEVNLNFLHSGNIFIQVLAGEWIPLQASLIRSDLFFKVGGFNPLLTAGEDLDFCYKIALQGNCACLPMFVAAVSRGGESTSNYALGLENSRREREKTLNKSQAFRRILASIDSGYWHGRTVRTYLASVIYNLRQKKLFTAASRIIMALISFFLGCKYYFHKNFWRGLTKSHITGSTS